MLVLANLHFDNKIYLVASFENLSKIFFFCILKIKNPFDKL